jgi:hypothetical protein
MGRNSCKNVLQDVCDVLKMAPICWGSHMSIPKVGQQIESLGPVVVLRALSELTVNGFSISKFLAYLFGRGFSEKWDSISLTVFCSVSCLSGVCSTAQPFYLILFFQTLVGLLCG